MLIPSYLCPICHFSLNLSANSFRCGNNHCFDQAKEGYVNLLPVQFKHSKEPGDNKEMVQARRAFLDKGFYQPLINHIVKVNNTYDSQNSVILDAGCGEGYYTHQHKSDNSQVYGVDIAKPTIKIAAKRYKDCFFSVGTLSSLPFADENFSWIYSIYAPIVEQEFARVLKKDGYILTVTPAENHLLELKSLIYREVKEHDTSRSSIENLTLISEERLHYEMSFENGQDVANLLAMTPFTFKASEGLVSKIKAMKTFKCQADFLIRLYQKN